MKLESEKGHSSVWAREEQSNSLSDTNSIAFPTVETESSEEVWGFSLFSAGSQCPAQLNHRQEQLHRLPGRHQRDEPSEVLDSPSELCEARKECKLMKVINSSKMQILRSKKVENQIRM
jgi:hypothetical protein